MIPGTRVRIERDETLYPSKGTWPWFRGKTGTVVEINHGECGVSFGKVRTPRSNGSIAAGSDTVWFQPWEVRALAAQSPLSHGYTVPRIDDTREVLAHV